MLSIQRRMIELGRIPAASKLGLGLMVAAGAFDVGVHLMSDVPVHHHAELGLDYMAHVLGIAGMLLVLAGVVISGARRQFRQRAARNGGFDDHAHR